MNDGEMTDAAEVMAVAGDGGSILDFCITGMILIIKAKP